MHIRICLLTVLGIVLLPSAGYCPVRDGGRVTFRINNETSINATIGGSLEFPEIFPDYALLSLFGETGVSIYEDSNRDPEFLGLVGLNLWFFPYMKLFPEVRVLLNIVDFFKTNQKVGWAIEGGTIIPVTDRFWLTFNLGRGTAFSISRNAQSHFSVGTIICHY